MQRDYTEMIDSFPKGVQNSQSRTYESHNSWKIWSLETSMRRARRGYPKKSVQDPYKETWDTTACITLNEVEVTKRIDKLFPSHPKPQWEKITVEAVSRFTTEELVKAVKDTKKGKKPGTRQNSTGSGQNYCHK